MANFFFYMLNLMLFFWLSSSLIACDPCKSLAEKICACKDSEDERRTCTQQLSIAEHHENFKQAKDPQVCDEALVKCSCQAINDSKDEKCGFYR